MRKKSQKTEINNSLSFKKLIKENPVLQINYLDGGFNYTDSLYCSEIGTNEDFINKIVSVKILHNINRPIQSLNKANAIKLISILNRKNKNHEKQ